jgi:hypothetical protein
MERGGLWTLPMPGPAPKTMRVRVMFGMEWIVRLVFWETWMFNCLDSVGFKVCCVVDSS